jgi:chromosome segregation ATPase
MCVQAELDDKAEMLAALDQQHRHAAGTSEELNQARQKLELQLAQADSHIKHLEQELQKEIQRGDVTKQNLVAAQQDYEQLRVSSRLN